MQTSDLYTSVVYTYVYSYDIECQHMYLYYILDTYDTLLSYVFPGRVRNSTGG